MSGIGTGDDDDGLAGALSDTGPRSHSHSHLLPSIFVIRHSSCVSVCACIASDTCCRRRPDTCALYMTYDDVITYLAPSLDPTVDPSRPN